MRNRLIFGPILIAAIVALAWLDDYLDRGVAPAWWPSWLVENGTLPPAIVVFPLLVALVALACGELVAMFNKKGVRVTAGALCISAYSGLGCWMVFRLPFAWAGAPAVVPSLAVLALIAGLLLHLRHRSPEGVLGALGASLLAFVYLGILPGFLLSLRVDFGVWVLLWVILVVKACDIGALFVGKAFGRHKLIPWLSPGKTWEGLLGGAVVAALAGVVGSRMLGHALPWGAASIGLVGLAGGVLGQLGDLVKSSFKRDAGIKDSGAIVPGLGGVIDIIDSPLFVAPFAYWLLILA